MTAAATSSALQMAPRAVLTVPVMSGLRGIGRKEGLTEPGTLLEVQKQVLVDQPASALVEGRVDGDDVALGYELLEVFDAARTEGRLGRGGERVVVIVQELLAVERLQTLQYALANAAGTDGADNLALKVICVAGDLRDIPVAALNHLPCSLLNL